MNNEPKVLPAVLRYLNDTSKRQQLQEQHKDKYLFFSYHEQEAPDGKESSSPYYVVCSAHPNGAIPKEVFAQG